MLPLILYLVFPDILVLYLGLLPKSYCDRCGERNKSNDAIKCHTNRKVRAIVKVRYAEFERIAFRIIIKEGFTFRKQQGNQK